MINKEDLTESCSHTLSPLVSKLEKKYSIQVNGEHFRFISTCVLFARLKKKKSSKEKDFELESI